MSFLIGARVVTAERLDLDDGEGHLDVGDGADLDVVREYAATRLQSYARTRIAR